MLCRVYNEAGQVVSEGPAGIRPDGSIELVPVRAQRALRPGDGPLEVELGSLRYPARVTRVHGPTDPTRFGPIAVYQLTPLAAEASPAAPGAAHRSTRHR